jgi:xanthine dehydrogenase YagS FAD-binding subunit
MNYNRPTDISAAIRELSAPDSVATGGGTDLLVTIREGLARPSTVIDLRALPDASSIGEGQDGFFRIGAGTTLAALAADSRVRDRFPALAQACDSVGSPALRNMGTLGGNLCQRPRCWYFRSGIPCLKSTGIECPAVRGDSTHLAIFGGGPCFALNPSDTAVALVALSAEIEVTGPAGIRRIPSGEFFVLPDPDPRRENVLGPGEFISTVVIPAYSSGGRQRYTKVLQRGAWDFALASIAAVRRVDGSVQLVLGGVAPIPWRVNPSVEEDVASGPLAMDDLEVLAERALYDARPLAGNAYKVTLVKNLLREAMAFLQVGI